MDNRNDELSTHLSAISNALFENEKVKDLISKSLLGLRASGSMYERGSCQWANKSVSDAVFIPKPQYSKDLPPIVVVVQNIINAEFMEELIRYSLSLYEKYKNLPILLVFLTEGFSNEEVESKFKMNNDAFMMETNCDFWANRCYVLSRESIHGFINEYPLQVFIALTRCIIDTENILHSNDPNIKFFLNLAKH